MICDKCKKRIKKTLIKCPYCGERIINKESFVLPLLKEEPTEETIELFPIDNDLSDNYSEIELKDESNDSEDFDHFEGIDNEESSLIDESLLLGETKQITLEDNNSLIDDINSEIENMSSDNENLLTSKDKEENAETLIKKDSISSEESLKKRKKILIISIINLIILLIIGFILFNIYTKSDHNNTKPLEETEVETSLNDILKDYYDHPNMTDLKSILEYIKNDEDKVSNYQKILKETCENWIKTYQETDVESSSLYEEKKDNLKNIINEIHTYVTVKNDKDELIEAITTDDYNTFIEEINTIYDYSKTYYDALALYNKKDYNKAYATYDKITNDNYYYDKSNNAKDKIISSIIKLIENDILKININIEDLTNDEKLSKYVQIEEIVLGYKRVYPDIPLDKNDSYNSILEEYENKIDELSNLKPVRNIPYEEQTAE